MDAITSHLNSWLDYFFILLDPARLVSEPQGGSIVVLGAMALMGLTGVTQGVKHRRGLVLGVAFILGWLAGTSINTRFEAAGTATFIIVASAFALLAVAAARHAAGGTLAVLTGATGAFLVAHLWDAFSFGDAESPRWVVPLAAFGFVAGMTMIAQTLSSAFLASFGGAIMLTIGGTGLLLQAPGLSEALASQISGSPLLIPSILVMLAAFSFPRQIDAARSELAAQASGELPDEDLEDDEEDASF